MQGCLGDAPDGQNEWCSLPQRSHRLICAAEPPGRFAGLTSRFPDESMPEAWTRSQPPRPSREGSKRALPAGPGREPVIPRPRPLAARNAYGVVRSPSEFGRPDLFALMRGWRFDRAPWLLCRWIERARGAHLGCDRSLDLFLSPQAEPAKLGLPSAVRSRGRATRFGWEQSRDRYSRAPPPGPQEWPRAGCRFPHGGFT